MCFLRSGFTGLNQNNALSAPSILIKKCYFCTFLFFIFTAHPFVIPCRKEHNSKVTPKMPNCQQSTDAFYYSNTAQKSLGEQRERERERERVTTPTATATGKPTSPSPLPPPSPLPLLIHLQVKRVRHWGLLMLVAHCDLTGRSRKGV